eukprot:CAMPEP_0182527456 /NCGR_PEP_ID=MMETSP1323-20130603/3858_1 /TAXON_ID=236787 /ORGANISM="Florenciella parvula, Strain RCC1693" /LENGTH=151 /DNA_ID=CAMNT_0024736443 /DNA_START=84 /DNA_END=535 /DNA_ORIENTATION=-
MNSTMFLERSNVNRVTPEQAEALARTFGVVASEEPHLMPLIRSLLYTPLPPDWSYDGAVFTNAVTGETTEEHPARNYFAQAIDDERERHLLEGNLHMGSALPDSNSQESTNAVAMPPPQSWVEFYGPDDTKYYHDFVTGEERQKPPEVLHL